MYRRTMLAGLALILMGACSPQPAAPELTISGAWVRVPPGGRDVTAGYLTIANAGGPDQLVSASAQGAEHVELHVHEEKDGMMQMHQVSHVDIPAGGEVKFQPGGYHLMIFGVGDWKEGDETTLSLHFAKSRDRTVSAKVQLPPNMGTHAGH